ncbi:LOW QUALITY PROTEIN: protein IL-40 [Dugong dugon]
MTFLLLLSWALLASSGRHWAGGRGGVRRLGRRARSPNPWPPPSPSPLRSPASSPGVRPVAFNISINYKVLEVFPEGRRVLITCYSTQMPLPITYTLWDSQGTELGMAVLTRHSASFILNVTLKSSPVLLTYSCHGASTSGKMAISNSLQMFKELWDMLLSQLQANFTLMDRGPGVMVEVICQVSLGSPPVTYSLVRKTGCIHEEQTPPHGEPANFSFPQAEMSAWP